MPKRKHVHVSSGKRKRTFQQVIHARSGGNDMMRQFRIARGLTGLRLHRRRTVRATFHSSIGQASHMSDVNMEPSSKRSRHEAHMIPGVDGDKVWGFPNSIITKLRYCTTKVLSGTTGARGLKVFSANGTYDPDISDTGHQPLYRDNYAALYTTYTVLGSKITVWYYNQGADNAAIVGIVGDDDTSISSSVETLMEQNNSVSVMHGTTGSPVTVLTSVYEPLEMIGVDAKDDGLSATPVAENPDDQWCYGVWAAAADGVSTIAISCKIEVEYTVKFSQLVGPVQN